MYNNNNTGTIELIEEYLNTNKANEICSLINRMSDELWCFSLRKCSMNDSDFEELIIELKNCSLLCYLNFNLNIINSLERATFLATLLPCLSNLHTLSLHSSNLEDKGLKLLYYSLINNANLKSLDIGDCKLTDNSVEYIREIIHRREHEHGLNELIISSNPNITLTGWSQILISVASASHLEYFYLDFNNLDDSCGYLIAAMLGANHTLKVLDLEHTGLTNKTASLLLYLLRNYSLTIKSLNLINNDIDDNLINEMQNYLSNDTNENSKMTNVDESMLLNESCDFKRRDQVKLDQYVKNSYRLDLNNSNFVTQFEQTLERDFKSLVFERNKSELIEVNQRFNEETEIEGKLSNSSVDSKVEESKLEENRIKISKLDLPDEEDDLLEPVYLDQRYSTHVILPFNHLND